MFRSIVLMVALALSATHSFAQTNVPRIGPIDFAGAAKETTQNETNRAVAEFNTLTPASTAVAQAQNTYEVWSC